MATSRPSSSPIPLYHQISTVLRQRVADGTYAPGVQLAPEDELAATFGVSRATIRQAVGELVKVGLLSRRQGHGTFVLAPADDTPGQVFRGNLNDLISAGEVRRTRLREVSIRHDEVLPPRAAERLALPEGRGTVIHRTRLLDDVPIAYTINYLPAAQGRLLDRASLQSHGILQVLADNGVTIDHAEQTIRAQLADLTVSAALETPLGSAVLFVERLLHTEDEEAVEFFTSWYRGDRYDYTVSFDRTDRGLDEHFA